LLSWLAVVKDDLEKDDLEKDDLEKDDLRGAVSMNFFVSWLVPFSEVPAFRA
jgi:hypothetical protein